MGLNIKSSEVCRLVQRLAQRTGESQTAAVLQAVRDRLERLNQSDPDALANRIIRIGADCAAHMKEPFAHIDHGDLLFGPDGLPR